MSRYVSRTTLMQTFFIGILGGLFLSKTGWFTNITFTLVGFALLPLIVRMRWTALIVAVAIGLNIGLWRGADVRQDLNAYRQFQDEKVTLTGTVNNDAAYADRGQLEFQLRNIREIELGVELPGTVNVRSFNVASVQRGDIVKASGTLREGFGSRQGFMSFASVEVIARDDSALERIRSEYFAGVYSALPEPQASLGLG